MADNEEETDVFPVFDFGTGGLWNGTVMVRLVYAETNDQMTAMNEDQVAATTAGFMLAREWAVALPRRSWLNSMRSTDARLSTGACHGPVQ